MGGRGSLSGSGWGTITSVAVKSNAIPAVELVSSRFRHVLHQFHSCSIRVQQAEQQRKLKVGGGVESVRIDPPDGPAQGHACHLLNEPMWLP